MKNRRKRRGVYLTVTSITLFVIVLFYNKSCNGIKTNETNRPNILLMVADDLGYGDLSSYGQKDYLTPTIDRLAEEGVLFTDFYVPVPYCAPSRATLLTGRFPLRHGMIQNPAPDAGINDIGIDDNELLLGEVLQGYGYSTSCIGKWHLGHKESYFPVNHGFDEYYGILYSNDMRPVQIIANRDTIEYPVDQNYLTKNYTERALDFIKRKKDKPFFLYLAHAMPHKPLAASPEYYTPDTPGDLYADAIRELDWSVDTLINSLKKHGILDNTIVIFMSDNGPWYGGSTGGLKGMKATSWEGGLRVPFIVRYPEALNRGKIIETPCWSADIFPTLLSLIDVPLPDTVKLDGIDITDIMKGNNYSHPPIYGLHRDEIKYVRKGKWKLFISEPRPHRARGANWVDPRRPDGKTIIAPVEQPDPTQYPGIMPQEETSEIMLFNLDKDPEESNNVAIQQPEVVESLLEQYQQFLTSLKEK